MIRSPEYREAKAYTRKVEADDRKARRAEALKRAKADIEAIASGQRKPRLRHNGHLQFIRRLPCVATYMQTGVMVFGVDAAHVRFADAAHYKPHTGAGRKPDDNWTVPLCRAAHEAQHGMSERAYWERLGVDVLDLCRALWIVSGDEERAIEIIRRLSDVARATTDGNSTPGLPKNPSASHPKDPS